MVMINKVGSKILLQILTCMTKACFITCACKNLITHKKSLGEKSTLILKHSFSKKASNGDGKF